MNSAVHISNMHNVASVTSHTGRCAVHREAGKKCVRKEDHIFLDRIDIQCDIQPVPFSDLSNMQPGESSEEIRKRVIRARQIQTERYKDSKLIHCNAQMTDRMIHEYCLLDEQTTSMLQMAMQRMNLSARAYSRILKVARTIADLEGKADIEMHHVAEAVGYRNLDRADWAER